MLLQVLQSGILPLGLVLLIAGLFNNRRGAALGFALATTVAWLWIKGWVVPWPPRAVDLVAASALLGCLFLYVDGNRPLSAKSAGLLAATLLGAMILWAHRMLLADWQFSTWVIAVVLPVAILVLSLVARVDLSQKDAANAGLALLAYQPLVLSIGGSLLMGQLGGVLTTGYGALWLLIQTGRLQLPARGLLTLALLPGLMLPVVGWQFAEISLAALALGLLLPLLYLALVLVKRLPTGWLLRHGLLVVALGIQLGIGLWLVWPEQSLY